MSNLVWDTNNLNEYKNIHSMHVNCWSVNRLLFSSDSG